MRVRADTFGYLQRSFPGFASAVDVAEARAVGEEAVRAASSGEHHSGSIAIRRLERDGHYAADYFVTPLDTVAKVTRTVPREWLNAAGNDVLPAWLDYVRPLVGDLPEIGRLVGHPLSKRLA